MCAMGGEEEEEHVIVSYDTKSRSRRVDLWMSLSGQAGSVNICHSHNICYSF